MLENVLKKLAENKISAYCIYNEQRESAELFFIKNRLDLSRSKKVEDIKLTVYRDFEKDNEKYRGSSEVYIYPDSTADEIDKLIKEAYFAAAYVQNPYFNLNKGVKEDTVMPTGDLGKHSLMENAAAMAKALYEADNNPDAFINSSEFFANKITVRIVNSEGCDVSYVKYNVEGEFVTQSRANNNDVEFHSQFEYDDLDTKALTAKCIDALNTVKDRAYAKTAPKDLSGIPVILCNNTVGELLSFYTSRANAGSVYAKYSPYTKGYDAQKEAVGERLNITLLPDEPYSSQGVKKSEHVLLDKGIVENIHGSVAYLEYLSLPQIGYYNKIKCDNGLTSLEEMKKTPYIMVKNFSDFQMDSFDGHFGGEFRLAYYFDGEKTEILTGGTVSGNLFEAQKNMIFSKEQYKDANYIGPAAVRL